MFREKEKKKETVKTGTENTYKHALSQKKILIRQFD